MAAWKKKEFKENCQTSGTNGHKSVDCPDKKESNVTNGNISNDNRNGGNNANGSGRCHFSSKQYYCGKVGHKINVCCTMKTGY